MYEAPDIPPSRITATLVRDELQRCLESANREFMHIMEQPVTDQALREQVQQFVADVFQGCGVSFDSPTKEGMLTVIDECKKKADAMMGARGAEIIRHHYQEMMKLIDKLPDKPSIS